MWLLGCLQISLTRNDFIVLPNTSIKTNATPSFLGTDPQCDLITDRIAYIPA